MGLSASQTRFNVTDSETLETLMARQAEQRRVQVEEATNTSETSNIEDEATISQEAIDLLNNDING